MSNSSSRAVIAINTSPFSTSGRSTVKVAPLATVPTAVRWSTKLIVLYGCAAAPSGVLVTTAAIAVPVAVGLASGLNDIWITCDSRPIVTLPNCAVLVAPAGRATRETTPRLWLVPSTTFCARVAQLPLGTATSVSLNTCAAAITSEPSIVVVAVGAIGSYSFCNLLQLVVAASGLAVSTLSKLPIQ